MKKFLKITGIVFASFTALTIIGVIIAIAGSSPGMEKIDLKDGKSIYKLTVEAKNGDGTKMDLDFTMSDSVMKVKNLDEKKFKKICESAIRYADFDAKNPLTYKFHKGGLLIIDTDGDLNMLIEGEAKNAFGVPNTIFTSIPFNNNLEVDSDKISSI